MRTPGSWYLALCGNCVTVTSPCPLRGCKNVLGPMVQPSGAASSSPGLSLEEVFKQQNNSLFGK